MLVFRLHVIVNGDKFSHRFYGKEVKSADQLAAVIYALPPEQSMKCMKKAREAWKDYPQYLCIWNIYGDEERYGMSECFDFRLPGRVEEFIAAHL